MSMEPNSSNPISIFVKNSIQENDSESSSKKTLVPPGVQHSPMTIALWEAQSSIFEKLLEPPLDAPPQTELLFKSPSQSRITILYNFSTDYVLREQYRDSSNEVRIGKLLHDLDALAGTISVKHCSDDDDDSTTRPLYLVTASVEKIVLKKPISVDVDLKVAGAVTWVGRSSLTIQLEATQPATDDTTDSTALTANFIFVARDYKTGKAAPVNRLIPETEREKLLAETRTRLRKRKLRDAQTEIENEKQIRSIAI